MKVYRFVQPYGSDGKPKFKERNRPGVYLIAEDGVLVYIGSAKNNLYSTMYRHFQTWNSRDQEVVTYVDKMKAHRYTVRIVLTTGNRSLLLEAGLILKYNPRDNINGNGQTRLNFTGARAAAERRAVADYLTEYAEPPDDLFL